MRLDEATAPFVANPHYERALLMREVERRQLELLEDERERRERAARADEEADAREDEFLRLRESERQLREQLAQMQRQMELINSRLCPPTPRRECLPIPPANRPEHLPCPTLKPAPPLDKSSYLRPAHAAGQTQQANYLAPVREAYANDELAFDRPRTIAVDPRSQPLTARASASSSTGGGHHQPLSSRSNAMLVRLPPID